jgi:hypothetical protein
MKQQYRFINPPRALRKATLYNIILVHASALPFKSQYQKIANSFPKGSVLICHSLRNKSQQKVFETMSMLFQQRGPRVTMLSTEGLMEEALFNP